MTSRAMAHPLGDPLSKTVQANKDHQNALKVYTERLDAELETISKLLTIAEASDNEDELEIDTGGTVVIPGSVKAIGSVSSADLLDEDSPFHRDATKRERYFEATTVHQWKSAELEALADAVRLETFRKQALEAQIRGEHGLTSPLETGALEQNQTGIDWERVALKVSSIATTNVQRSAQECKIRWLGDRHPQFNHSQWTQAEVARVRELVSGAVEGQVNWEDIAAKLGTRRTPIDCMRHAITRRTHTWTIDADERLMKAVDIYGSDNWSIVARCVSEDATPSQCQNRYMRTLDPDIKRGPWTAEEDRLLRRAVSALGHSWLEVALFIPGRSNEQCRDRYQEVLNPTIHKGSWTEDEDRALLQAVEQTSDISWKDISKLLGNGRTDQICRTRYSALLKRKQIGGSVSPSPDAPHDLERYENLAEPSAVNPTQQSLQSGASTHSSSSVDPTRTSESHPVATPRPRPIPRPRHKGAKQSVQNPSASIGSDMPGSSASPATVASEPTKPTRRETKRSLPTGSAEKTLSKPRKRPRRDEDVEPDQDPDTRLAAADTTTSGNRHKTSGNDEQQAEAMPSVAKPRIKTTRRPRKSRKTKANTSLPDNPPQEPQDTRVPGSNSGQSPTSATAQPTTNGVIDSDKPDNALESTTPAAKEQPSRRSSRLASMHKSDSVSRPSVPTTHTAARPATKRRGRKTQLTTKSSNTASAMKHAEARRDSVDTSYNSHLNADEDSSELSTPPSSP